MAKFDHFSHDHQLKWFEVDDDEDTKPYQCSVCGLPILSSPSYICTITNCNFFLHKPCSQFPQEFFHEDHNSTLYLEQPNSTKSCRYKCKKHSDCEFDLHPLVARPVEIRSKHLSHRHPLVAVCQEMSCLCGSCDEEHKGFFFHCGDCNFWIHQDCIILPSLVKLPSHHPHFYHLTYSLGFDIVSRMNCSICRRSWRLRHSGVYFCGECYSLVHTTCAKSSAEFVIMDSRKESIQLPDDEDDKFPSLVIRKSKEINTLHHEHPLVLEGDGSSTSRDLVCDVCVQRIGIPSLFYRCNTCHFVAHHICVNHLPSTVKILYIDATSGLGDSAAVYKNSVFPCLYCLRPSNGFSYCFLSEEGRMTPAFDVECAVTPKIIKHSSHRQHVLYQTARWRGENFIGISCCNGESVGIDVYRCILCPFFIHMRCALLPKKTRHKFDEHPLELIMTNEEGRDDGLFCEFCEEDIDHKYWYYGCRKCEQYFHINCIPSVGYMSKVKFGRSFVDNNVHPEHPLALTRMLTNGRHERCGVCYGRIEGCVDEMAFHCSTCYFWTHFSCARNSATGLRLYSEYLQGYQLFMKEERRQEGIE